MNQEIIASLYEYDIWANTRLLAKAEMLSDEQLHRKFSDGYKPLLENFAHLAAASWRWYKALAQEPVAPLSPADFAVLTDSLPAARAKLEGIYAERRAFIASLTDEQLHATITRTRGDSSYTILLWQGFMQAANHATQHRSEIAAMLTDLGQSPGDLDFLWYCLEQRK